MQDDIKYKNGIMNCNFNTKSASKFNLVAKGKNALISALLLFCMDWWWHSIIIYRLITIYYKEIPSDNIITFVVLFYTIYSILLMGYTFINSAFNLLDRFKFTGVFLCSSIVYIFFSTGWVLIFVSVSTMFNNVGELFIPVSGNSEPQPFYLLFAMAYVFIALCGACFYRVLK